MSISRRCRVRSDFAFFPFLFCPAVVQREDILLPTHNSLRVFSWLLPAIYLACVECSVSLAAILLLRCCVLFISLGCVGSCFGFGVKQPEPGEAEGRARLERQRRPRPERAEGWGEEDLFSWRYGKQAIVFGLAIVLAGCRIPSAGSVVSTKQGF